MKLVSFSLSFEYDRDLSSMSKDINYCAIGSSFLGEAEVKTFGNHEIGSRDLRLPPVDYSKVVEEIVYILLLGVAIVYGPHLVSVKNCCYFKAYQRLQKQDRIVAPFCRRRHLFATVQVPLMIVTGIMCLWNMAFFHWSSP
jgi:hypothetical protein